MEAISRYGAFAAAALLGLAGFALGDYGLLAWMGAAVLVCLGLTLQSARWGVLASALLGLGSSAYLFQRKLDASGTSVCNVSETINCDVVNSSAASMLFGLPVALLGSAFFLGVAVAAMMTPSRSTRIFQPIAALGLAGTAFSVHLAYQSWLIGAVCVMCMGIYAANALLVLGGVLGAKEEAGSVTAGLDEIPKSSAWMVIAAVFAVVLLLGQSVWKSSARPDVASLLEPKPQPGGAAPAPAPQPEGMEPNLYAKPAGPITLTDDEPILGNPGGRYQIVEYADFMCPHCAQAFPFMHQLVEQNPEVGVHFRTYALTGECNPSAQPGNHPERCRAAMAAMCAHEQGKFWDYAGMLFSNQHQLGDELFAAAAQQLGLDFERFSTCMTQPSTLERVQRDGASGGQLQLFGTPAFFVKGVVGDGWVESCAGPYGAVRLIMAAAAGEPIPPSELARCSME